MLLYLDSNIVIYLVEQPSVWGAKAAARLSVVRASGDTLVVSELTRMECRVRPLALRDAVTLSHFDAFLGSSDVHVVGLTRPVIDRATAIRAYDGIKAVDALHLAAAIETGCHVFVTSDKRLMGFRGIVVEELT